MKRAMGWSVAGLLSLTLAAPLSANADDNAPRSQERPGDRPSLRERLAEGDRPGRGEGNQRPGFAGRDPEQIATMMIRQFDKDGDSKLDAKELAAMMTAMRERGAGMMGRPGANPGADGARMREMMENRRRGTAEGADQPGGVRPKRPPMDEPNNPAKADDAA